MTAFGNPFEVRPQSIVSTLVVDPTVGFDVSRSPLNLPNGATPNSDNYVMREGRLQPRPKLSRLTDSTNNVAVDPLSAAGAAMTGGLEVVSVDDTRYLMTVWSGIRHVDFLRTRSDQWQEAGDAVDTLNFPAGIYPTMWDWTQMFYDQAGENAAFGVPTDRSGMVLWVAGAATTSLVTGAPGAACLATFENYLLAANTKEGADIFTQRVRWCDRGSASSWTGGLSGYEDIFQAKGGINRMVALEDRVAVFFDDEVWAGALVDFPNTFRFAPWDTSVGSPYPWSVTKTPAGIIFMARNFQLYLLPKGGGNAVAIGKPVHKSIRDNIKQASRAFGLYNGVDDRYEFYFSSGESGYVPHRAVFLQLSDPQPSWAPQSFASGNADLGLTFGFPTSLNLGSKATAWNAETLTYNQATISWDDYLGIGSEVQAVVLGSSGGTIYQWSKETTLEEGAAVRSVWETPELGAEWPGQQKTILEVRADYLSPSGSSLTVRELTPFGYNVGQRIPLPASSLVSQNYAHMRTPNRYAAVRVEQGDALNDELHRLHVTMRVGGR